MRENILKTKEWLYKNPKKVFYSSFSLILFSMILSVIQYFFFPPAPITAVIPKFNHKSDVEIEKMEKKKMEMESIVKKMKILKIKRDENQLTKKDSLEAEYLMFKLNKIKDGL